MQIKNFLIIIILSIFACSCANKPLDKNQPDYEFKKDLIKDYEKLASLYDDEGVYNSVSFSYKVDMLSKGKMVYPSDPRKVESLSKQSKENLTVGREILMTIFSNSFWSYEVNPRTSAATQVYYDCWLAQEATGEWGVGETPCEARFHRSVDLLMQAIASRQNFVSYAGTVNSIYFDFDSHQIKGESIPRINLLLRQLKKVDNINLVLYGYTDRVGKKKYNKNLAKERLSAVIQVIKDSGALKNKKIKIISQDFGENDPLISPQTVLNNPHSRRVDIFIVSK